MAFLEIRHVSKHYAQHTALDDVSLSIDRGKVFGLLGPNGAGKTSLIRIINRITAPDAGEVLMDGGHIMQKDVEKIGYLPEERGLYRKMKVGEHAIYLARLKGIPRAEAVERLKTWFEKFDIMPWWDKKVEELSKGMQQKVQFVCTVIHDPDLLIFDEPFSGFDPVNADLLKNEILELRDKGKTVIFSTHNMQSVEEVCDHIALINKSRVVLKGAVADIRQANKTDIVNISYEGTLEAQSLAHFNILSINTSGTGGYLRIQKDKHLSNRDILNALPLDIIITSFNEEIPSMHDIFVNTVKNNLTHE